VGFFRNVTPPPSDQLEFALYRFHVVTAFYKNVALMNAECFKIKVSHIISNFTKLHHCCHNSCICMTDIKSVAGMKTTVMNSLIIHKHPLIPSTTLQLCVIPPPIHLWWWPNIDVLCQFGIPMPYTCSLHPTCSPQRKYLWPSVTWTFSVIGLQNIIWQFYSQRKCLETITHHF